MLYAEAVASPTLVDRPVQVLSAVEVRLLSVLHGCGPQPALALDGAHPATIRRGLPATVVDMTAREAGCGPASDSRRDLDALVARGLVRLSTSVLDSGRYLVLEDEHAGKPALRCSIVVTRAGRRAMADR